MPMSDTPEASKSLSMQNLREGQILLGYAPAGGDVVSAPAGYADGSRHHHHQAPNGQPSAPAPTDVRPAHSFYPNYPTTHSMAASSGTTAGATSSTLHNVIGSSISAAHAPPPSHATTTSTTRSSTTTASTPTTTAARVRQRSEEDDDRHRITLFGQVPEAKRRKFILVNDDQRHTRVRVRVTLDNVHLEEMPDAYRKSNSVYPRSFFPMQMQSPPLSPRGRRYFEGDVEEDALVGTGSLVPTSAAAGRGVNSEGKIGGSGAAGGSDRGVGHTLVPVPLLDGSEASLPLPRMNRARRSKEVALNDLGYRMSWSQGRVFSGRHLFLQRSLDAYRNKMRNTMVAAGQDVTSVAPHFETRIGKKRWLERSKKIKREKSP